MGATSGFWGWLAWMGWSAWFVYGVVRLAIWVDRRRAGEGSGERLGQKGCGPPSPAGYWATKNVVVHHNTVGPRGREGPCAPDAPKQEGPYG